VAFCRSFATAFLYLGEEDVLDDDRFIREEFIEFFFNKFFDLGTLGTDIFGVILADNTGNTTSGVWTNDFGNEVITYLLPELGGVGFVDLKEDRAFDGDDLVVLGGNDNGFISEGLSLAEVKTVPDRIFEDLTVEKFCYLPEGNFEVESRSPNSLENSKPSIVNAGYVSRRNGDKETSDYFVDEE